MKHLPTVLIVTSLIGCGPSATQEYDAALTSLETEQKLLDRMERDHSDLKQRAIDVVTDAVAAAESNPADDALVEKAKRYGLEEVESSIAKLKQQDERVAKAKRRLEEARARMEGKH
jgi:hypothetical protein